MVAKQRITRKEIKQPDQFISTSVRIIEFANAHRQQIFTGVGALAVLLFIIFGWRYYSGSIEKKALDLVGEGLVLFHDAQSEDKGGAVDEELEKRYRGAVEKFQQAASTYARTRASSQANLYLGQIRFRLGQLDEAIGNFETVLDQVGKKADLSAIAFDGLGYCYEKKGEHQKAAEAFREIVHMESSHLKENAYLNAARNYRILGEKDRAIDLYESMLEQFRGSSNASMVQVQLDLLKDGSENRQERKE